MTRTFRKVSTGAAVLAACSLAGAAVAWGAGATTKAPSKTKTATTATTAKTAHTPETALTGDTLAKVKAAAIAKVGGTVDSATSENDSSNAAAAYEAHVTKADGTHVKVILDASFAVLSVETGHARGGHDHGRGGGNGETELTGDVATKAKAAALAKTGGGTVERATTETDGSTTAAAYEVQVTKADGSEVKVILDKTFAVLSVETHTEGPGSHGEHHH